MNSSILTNFTTDNGKFYDAYEEGARTTIENRENELNFWLNIAQKYPNEILEIACGTGRITTFLATNEANITGVDYSSSMLEAAKEKNPNMVLHG